jgi:DNA-binding transcriptional LysR family regulator
MEIRELEYFIAVAESQSFSRAARTLHVVQSGVSATIRRLEAELNAELFDRSSQPIELTEAGKALLPRARATIDAAREAHDIVAASVGRISGPLSLGMMTSVTSVDLPRILAQLAAEHPAVEIRLRTSPGGSRGLADQVVNRELDAAFLSFPGLPPAGLDVVELSARRLRLVVHQGHLLEGRGRVQLEELSGERFIDSPLGYGNRTLVDNAFTAAGVRRSVALEVADIATATEYIRRGLGVGFLSDDLVRPGSGLVSLDVSDADLTWRLLLATPAGRTPSRAMRAFRQILDDVVSFSVRRERGLALNPCGVGSGCVRSVAAMRDPDTQRNANEG